MYMSNYTVKYVVITSIYCIVGAYILCKYIWCMGMGPSPPSRAPVSLADVPPIGKVPPPHPFTGGGVGWLTVNVRRCGGVERITFCVGKLRRVCILPNNRYTSVYYYKIQIIK